MNNATQELYNALHAQCTGQKHEALAKLMLLLMEPQALPGHTNMMEDLHNAIENLAVADAKLETLAKYVNQPAETTSTDLQGDNNGN